MMEFALHYQPHKILLVDLLLPLPPNHHKYLLQLSLCHPPTQIHHHLLQLQSRYRPIAIPIKYVKRSPAFLLGVWPFHDAI